MEIGILGELFHKAIQLTPSVDLYFPFSSFFLSLYFAPVCALLAFWTAVKNRFGSSFVVGSTIVDCGGTFEEQKAIGIDAESFLK
jgi:hypothetical protein